MERNVFYSERTLQSPARKYTFPATNGTSPACRISQCDDPNVNNVFFGFTRLCIFAKLIVGLWRVRPP
ncbi:MAG TPA: hypothetical protein PLP42_03505, partial [Acidobacteriota bacterium]|nr:hypothetical protein [Acidobacteriota bacterium]